MALKKETESVHIPRHAAEGNAPDRSAPRHAAKAGRPEKSDVTRAKSPSRKNRQAVGTGAGDAPISPRKRRKLSNRQLQKAAKRIWSVSPWTVIMLTFLAVVIAAMLFPRVEDTHVDRNQAPNSYLVLSWDQTGRYGTPGHGKDAPIEFRVPYGVYNVLNNNSIPVVLTISTDGYVAPPEKDTDSASAVALSARSSSSGASDDADETGDGDVNKVGAEDDEVKPDSDEDGESIQTGADGSDPGSSDVSASDSSENTDADSNVEVNSDAEGESDTEEAPASSLFDDEEEEDTGKPVSVTMRPNSSRQIIIDENQYLTLSEEAKELILFYVSEVPEEIESDTTGQYADSQAVVYAYVKGTEVRFRSQPSLDGHIIEVLNNGQQVQVLGVTGEWTHVQIQDHKGYIYSEFLSRQEQDAPGIH